MIIVHAAAHTIVHVVPHASIVMMIVHVATQTVHVHAAAIQTVHVHTSSAVQIVHVETAAVTPIKTLHIHQADRIYDARLLHHPTGVLRHPIGVVHRSIGVLLQHAIGTSSTILVVCHIILRKIPTAEVGSPRVAVLTGRKAKAASMR